jgi:hypothetical protein
MYVIARHEPGRPKEWMTAWGTWTVNPRFAKRLTFGRHTVQTGDSVFIEFAPRGEMA